MKDLSFFKAAAGVSLAEIAARVDAIVPPGADASRSFDAAVALVHARPGQVAAFWGDDAEEDLVATNAGACLVSAGHAHLVPATTVALVTPDPSAAFQAIALLLHPASARPGFVLGLHASSPVLGVVHDAARLEPGVVLDPGVVVGPGAEIGARTFVGAHAVIGPGVRIGRDCTIDAHVTIVNALIGDKVVLQASARVGHIDLGDVATGRARQAAIGRVILQNDVEVGVHAAIPRGFIDDTVIGEGTVIEAFASIRQGTMIERRSRISSTSP